MVFFDCIWKYCPDTVISIGAYIVFYQGGKIDHCTNVPGSVSQSSSESEYNSACTAGMDIAHTRMLNNEFLNKDLYVFP